MKDVAASAASDAPLRYAGLLAWLAVCALWTQPPTPPPPTAWLALALFGAAYVAPWSSRVELSRHGGAIALAVQTLCALWVCRAGRSFAEGSLLAVIAGQLPFFVAPRAAAAWCVAQTVGLFLCFLSAGTLPGTSMLIALVFGAFEAFALGSARVAVSERRAREELGRQHAELLATRSLLASASRGQERLRISRELHDSLGHHLTALGLQLEAARVAGAGAAAESVAKARGIAKELLSQIRAAVSELREEAGVDLPAALSALSQALPSPALQVLVAPGFSLEDPAAGAAILRCVQELATNAARHGRARRLTVQLQRGPEGSLRVIAQDDGRGAAPLVPGNGLKGLRERVVQLGGRVTLSSSPGEGVRAEIELPQRGAGERGGPA